MTDELKKIFFSPQISNVFIELNWIINIDTKKKFYSYFVGDIADYYLNVQHNNGKIYLKFALDIEIPKNKLNELLLLIIIANQNSKEGFFVFDFNVMKIKYKEKESMFGKMAENINDIFKMILLCKKMEIAKIYCNT